MKLLSLTILAALALIAVPDSPVVHEAHAMECIINCYVCVTEPCGPPGPGERLRDLLERLPLPCDVDPNAPCA